MKLPYPVIFVPGITACHLQDEYEVPPQYVWSVLKKQYERIALHPNDLRYEAQEPARVRASHVFEVAYEDLIEELRYNLRRQEDRPVPVYPFAYDWRMPLDQAEAQLGEFVQEVIDRTKLLRHYHEEGFAKKPKVNLVAHSMGGLVVTGYLERFRKNARVHRVVTLATPFQGSFEAVIKVTTGTANLGTSAPSSREREMARITPALYHLLPSFENGLKVESDRLPDTLFDPKIWQPTIIDSLKEFIRLKGLPTTQDHQQAAADLFAGLLEQAKEHRQRTDTFKPSQAGLGPRSWLAVVGVDATTRVKLRVTESGRKAQFAFDSKDRMNGWEEKAAAKRRLTGDGTVPFEGAIPKFLKEENLVCVSPDDFGYWEIRDKLLNKVAGFHGMIPNMNMIHRLVVRFLTGGADRRGNTWGRPAPGVKEWLPPLSLRNKEKK